MTTNILKIPLDKLVRLMSLLSDNGVTAEKIDYIIKHPHVAREFIAVWKKHPTFRLVHGLFQPADDQIAAVQALNDERRWGFTKADFDRVSATVPEWPPQPTFALVLVPQLPDKEGVPSVQRTTAELWRAVRQGQRPRDPDEELLHSPEHVRLVEGARCDEGLHWEILDVASYVGASAVMPPAEKRPHTALLACAILHPFWISAIDGTNVPSVCISGLEINTAKSPDAPDAWKCHPVIGYKPRRSEIELIMVWNNGTSQSRAMPIRVG